jgi:hypothetical protein
MPNHHPELRCRRGRGDRGAASSLAIALLTPVLVVLSFAAFQAAMWSHARTEARVVARDTAALVARSDVSPTDAQSSALAVLDTDTDLANVRVTVAAGLDLVTVTVSGDAPGIIRGTSSSLSVSVAVPREGWTP